MYRTALRSSPSALRAIRPTSFVSGSRRLLSTSSASKPRTWKGTGLRWGLAIGAVYFYNTSPIFADELPPQTTPVPAAFSDSDLPTVEAIVEEKKRQTATAVPPPPPTPATEEPAEAVESTEAPGVPVAAPEPGSPEALEQEADQQGAFNPETGEINWDCPCLGGMAHGPCGEEFKAAFSCFVYSKEEPKGMDCIDKFQHMQDCFRQYPEIYGSEIADDEEEGAPAPAPEEALAKQTDEATIAQSAVLDKPAVSATEADEKAEKAEKVKEEAKKVSEEVVPKESHDATKVNKGEEQ